MLVLLPWAVATFGDPPRGRLPAASGLIGGLSILLYWATSCSVGCSCAR